MRSVRLIPVLAAMLAACDGATTPAANTLVSDDAVRADVAAASGDAIASALVMMAGNEAALGLSGSSARAEAAALTSNSLDVQRSRTCYDANDAVVANCSPLAAVRRVVTALAVNGTRSGSHQNKQGATINWTGAVHRTASDTMTRNFNGDVEVSRTHTGVAVAHDTTTMSDGTTTRIVSEAARDSVKGLTWNLPRSSNPFPVAGTIIRVDSVHVVATRGSETREREMVWTIRVDFPADAQGNVVLQVNGKTCNLNLVTRAVSNCQ